MFIVSKLGDTVYNTDFIEQIYITEKMDGATVAVRSGATYSGTIGRYENMLKAKTAVSILMRRMSMAKEGYVAMPNDIEVDAEPVEREVYHHITGKKTKGHGGS